MALAAEDPTDRVGQLISAATNLIAFAKEETAAISARRAPLSQARQEEKLRLANAFRFEMARIEKEPSLVLGAPRQDLTRLKDLCAQLKDAASAHRDALAAVKEISEGLVEALAQEAARQKGSAPSYGATGTFAAPNPGAVALDKRA
jgi:hypothetical protein